VLSAKEVIHYSTNHEDDACKALANFGTCTYRLIEDMQANYEQLGYLHVHVRVCIYGAYIYRNTLQAWLVEPSKEQSEPLESPTTDHVDHVSSGSTEL